MALTLSEKFRMSEGGREFRFITVTHDQATSTFTAFSVDLTYIEGMVAGAPYIASTPANLSVYLEHTYVSITGENDTVSFTQPPEIGSKTQLILVGW